MTAAYRDQGMARGPTWELSTRTQPADGDLHRSMRVGGYGDRFSLGRAAVPQMSKWKRLGWEARALLV